MLEPALLGARLGRAGRSRATLYKYFTDVDSILVVAHRRHVQAHLALLHGALERHGDPREALATYAEIQEHRAGHDMADLADIVHAPAAHHDHAQQAVQSLLRQSSQRPGPEVPILRGTPSRARRTGPQV